MRKAGAFALRELMAVVDAAGSPAAIPAPRFARLMTKSKEGFTPGGLEYAPVPARP